MSETTEKYHIHPAHFVDYDDEEGWFQINVFLPEGVLKENIHAKVLEDAYRVTAIRDEVAEYHIEDILPFLADVESVEAEYAEGILTLSGRIKDRLEEAKEIKL